MGFDPHRKIATLAEAMVALDRLARRFGPRPSIVWSPRRRRARASYLDDTILIGPRNRRALRNSLLHEYAHHLAKARGERRRRASHGVVFYEALVEVTTFWYGHTSQYAWASEYRCLIRRALRDGWLVPGDEAARLHFTRMGLLPAIAEKGVV